MAEKETTKSYIKNFVPYCLAALLVGVVGGFSTVLGPAFVSDLNLNYNNTTWTALATAISTAAFAPILGKLGDVIGRKTTLLAGIAVFTLGNVLTALANSLIFMLIARFTVGVGTAAIAPVILSYIIAEFPRDKSAKGFSVYMLISSAAVVFGPTLGGLIIEYFGWRAMVWVCVAICAVIFLLCLIFHGKDTSERRPVKNFDGLGAAFVIIFFSLVLCIPSFGQNLGWNSKYFYTVLIGAAISFIGLYFCEKKAKNPILQPSFIKRKSFILSVIALFLTQGLMQANMTNIIIFINYTQPQNTVISGYAISIMYVGMSLGSVILGPLADRVEPKKVLVGSFLITAAGCALMLLFTQQTSVILLAASLGILGFGLGGNATIFLKVVLSGVHPETAGAGTGTYGLFRDLSAPFGVAVLVPLFTNTVTSATEAGTNGAIAAMGAVKLLAIVEIICVILGIVAVLFLPSIYKKEKKIET